MTIFNVLTLIGGLAMFLYGMNVMGNGLEKLAGGKLEKIFERLTSNPIKAMLLLASVVRIHLLPPYLCNKIDAHLKKLVFT